jgi:hypothetical protein
MPCFDGPRSPYRFLKGLLLLSLPRRQIPRRQRHPQDGPEVPIQSLRLY